MEYLFQKGGCTLRNGLHKLASERGDFTRKMTFIWKVVNVKPFILSGGTLVKHLKLLMIYNDFK